MTTPKEAAACPLLPNASIDFDQLHKNAKAGKTGDEMLKGAVHEPPAPPQAEPSPAPAGDA